jgi:hypothetical protein
MLVLRFLTLLLDLGLGATALGAKLKQIEGATVGGLTNKQNRLETIRCQQELFSVNCDQLTADLSGVFETLGDSGV